MEQLNNLDLSECFKEGSQTAQKLKRMNKGKSEEQTDVGDSKTLRETSLNNLNDLVNKRIYQ